MFRRIRRPATLAVGAGMATLAAVLLLKQPSHERGWKPEYARLPAVARTGDLATVTNVRDFAYRDDGTVLEARYRDETLAIAKLSSAWYGIAHFADHGLAHSFLSFGFDDGRYLAFSVEARQEFGEDYGLIGGLLRNFELIYVVGTERDIIGLRTHIRKNRVLLYELSLSAQRRRALFEDMLRSVAALQAAPSFYNTLTDNCTTNIVQHADELSAFERFFDYRILLPGYSDGLAVEIGAVATDLPLEQLRAASRLDPDGIALDDPDFSTRIRRGLPK